jgi:hypothetical protein
VAELRLSEDGMYYWDGRQWVTTLSSDGRWRWNGTSWVPATAMVAPSYTYYQQPATVRVPTSWTKPMQYAIVAWYGLSAIYALSLPFWMSSAMAQMINQSFQRQVQLNPNVSPPPPDFVNSMTSIMSGVLWVAALIGVGISVVIIIGALKRWTWMFYVVLVLLGLGAISLPFNLFNAISGSTSTLTSFAMPSAITWLSVATGIPDAALFVWMLIGAIRYGPWAMSKKGDYPAPAAPAPPS